jgi:putative aldouronate transport system permease protein
MTDMNQTSASEDQALLAETIKYATIIVATLPVLVLYPFLQKYFVKGVMVGSLKG